jgi:hypothetical protein
MVEAAAAFGLPPREYFARITPKKLRGQNGIALQTTIVSEGSANIVPHPNSAAEHGAAMATFLVCPAAAG